MKHCKPFIEEGVHPRVIIRAFRKATVLAVDKINDLAVSVAKYVGNVESILSKFAEKVLYFILEATVQSLRLSNEIFLSNVRLRPCLRSSFIR